MSGWRWRLLTLRKLFRRRRDAITLAMRFNVAGLGYITACHEELSSRLSDVIDDAIVLAIQPNEFQLASAVACTLSDGRHCFAIGMRFPALCDEFGRPGLSLCVVGVYESRDAKQSSITQTTLNRVLSKNRVLLKHLVARTAADGEWGELASTISRLVIADMPPSRVTAVCRRLTAWADNLLTRTIKR
jgi:hypothetical protein